MATYTMHTQPVETTTKKVLADYCSKPGQSFDCIQQFNCHHSEDTFKLDGGDELTLKIKLGNVYTSSQQNPDAYIEQAYLCTLAGTVLDYPDGLAGQGSARVIPNSVLAEYFQPQAPTEDDGWRNTEIVGTGLVFYNARYESKGIPFLTSSVKVGRLEIIESSNVDIAVEMRLSGTILLECKKAVTTESRRTRSQQMETVYEWLTINHDPRMIISPGTGGNIKPTP